MEGELQIASSLMAAPKKDIPSLIKAQLGFMNLFAIPLFQGVADIMPGMKYTVDELEINKARFEQMMEEEKAKETEKEEHPGKKRLHKEGTLSPRTMSYAIGMKEENQDAGLQKKKGGNLMEGISEVLSTTPSTLVDGKPGDEEAMDPIPSDPSHKPSHIPQSSEEYKEVNGKVSSYEAVRQLANSDPFNSRDSGHGQGEEQGGSTRTDDSSTPPARQRSSDTTEGSTSAGLTGDWASQATSAATGKMPMSPSTKGTSIVSKESVDRPSSAPGPERRGHKGHGHQGLRSAEAGDNDGSTSTGSLGKAEGKSLKKKTSRFRMKDFPFFRRHKGSNAQPTDTAG